MSSPHSISVGSGGAGGVSGAGSTSHASRSISETTSHTGGGGGLGSTGSHHYQTHISSSAGGGHERDKDRGSNRNNAREIISSVCEDGGGVDLNTSLPLASNSADTVASIDGVNIRENNINSVPGGILHTNSRPPSASASTSSVTLRQKQVTVVGGPSNSHTPHSMSRPKGFDVCCECIPTQNRCATETCPCFREKRICDEHCESNRYRGDCLNQAICKCNCELESQTSAVSGTPAPAGTKSKSICSKADKCECIRLREGCNILCKCKQICKNREVKRAAKTAKPKQGCTCAKSKRQCVKKDCPCRTAFEFCGANCKCQSDCTNSQTKFYIPKHIQSCFLEHKNESSGLVLTLLGDDYLYRTEFYHDSKSEPHVEEQLVAVMYELLAKYKLDIYEIIIYVSKSPCFHQDCDPRCEVVEDCKSNKACSKMLGIMLSKMRKELGKVDVKMTVRFLFPHLHRGDLYTKQGVLCMMQSGITVEPLLMKDWSTLMDWSLPGEHKGDYLKLWNEHVLDKAVAQSQSFINECRRAMGLSMKFWVAEIHEIVKNTILNYTDIRNKLGELNDGLKQLDLTATPSKIRSTPSKRRSFLDMLELKDRMTFIREPRNKNGSNHSLPADDPQTQQMVASFCGRSFDDTETNEIAQRIRRATANINLEIESLLEFLHMKGN